VFIKAVFKGPSTSGLVEVAEQKLQASLGLLKPSQIPAVVMPELRSHVGNFPDIEASLQDLQCGLLALLDVGSDQSLASERRQLLTNAQSAFHRVAKAREHIASFARPPGSESLLDLPIDLAQLRQSLQEKRPYQNPKEQLEKMGAAVKKLCGVVSRSLEYVINIYQRDLASFASTPGEHGAVIQRVGEERIASTRLALTAIGTLVDALDGQSRPASSEQAATTPQAQRRLKAPLA
jgi:hypothetical protein